MTALLLAVAIAAGAAAYAAFAAFAAARGVPYWALVAGVPLAYAAVPLVFTSIWFALAWLWRSPRPPQARLSIAGSARLFLGEWSAITQSGVLMLLHRVLIAPPVGRAGADPVILVHGVMCNDGVWWSFLRALGRAEIRNVYTMNYGWNGDIDTFAEELHRLIDKVLLETGRHKVAIVGHSMGGLVSRAFLQRHGGARVSRLVTLGTPHHGSMLTSMFTGRCVRQMRPGGPWLEALNADEGSAPPTTLVSLWSWHDNMVVPQQSSVLRGARNVGLVGVGHNAMLRDAGVQSRVAALLLER